MKDFLNDCLTYYAMATAFIFWLPLMIIAIPLAFVAVCIKISYQVMSEMFEVVEDE